MKNLARIVAALALSLAIVAPVSAASTATTTVDLTVAASIDMTGIPPTISLGTVSASGDDVHAAPFTISIATNAAAWHITAATAGLSNGTGGSIGPSNVRVNNDGLAVAPTTISANAASYLVDFHVIVPSGKPAGHYTGTVSWAAIAD